MKVGMIFECGPQGADKKVCERFARQIKPDIQIISVTLDNKPNLVSNCGKVAAQLIKQGCDRVLIVWDLYPAWREKGHNHYVYLVPFVENDQEFFLKTVIPRRKMTKQYFRRIHAFATLKHPASIYRLSAHL